MTGNGQFSRNEEISPEMILKFFFTISLKRYESMNVGPVAAMANQNFSLLHINKNFFHSQRENCHPKNMIPGL